MKHRNALQSQIMVLFPPSLKLDLLDSFYHQRTDLFRDSKLFSVIKHKESLIYTVRKLLRLEICSHNCQKHCCSVKSRHSTFVNISWCLELVAKLISLLSGILFIPWFFKFCWAFPGTINNDVADKIYLQWNFQRDCLKIESLIFTMSSQAFLALILPKRGRFVVGL